MTSPAVLASATTSASAAFQAVRDGGEVIGGQLQGFGPVHAVGHVQLPQQTFGVLIEVGVQAGDGPVDPAGADGLPECGGRFLPGFPAAEDQQVGHGVGAGCFAVRAGGQADGSHEVGQLVHFPAGCRVGAVQGEAGRQHSHHATRAGQFQGLEDEVVVDRVAAGVVAGIVRA